MITTLKYTARMERLWSSVDLRGLCIGAAYEGSMNYIQCYVQCDRRDGKRCERGHVRASVRQPFIVGGTLHITHLRVC